MTLDQLKTFYVVARAGSFTNAAAQLNMDQSNVSRKIISMEIRFRAKLFTRQSRGLILTPEGRILLNEAEEILTRIDGMKNLIKNVNKEEKGLLSIQVMSGVYERYIFPYLDQFLTKYPGIQVVINKGDERTLNIDPTKMSVMVGPYLFSNEDNITQFFLKKFQMKLYVSPDYLKKFPPLKVAADLDHHQLIACGPDTSTYSSMSWHLTLKSSRRDGKPRDPYVETNCFKTQLELAKTGMGVALLPEELVGETRELVQVLPRDQSVMDLFYIYPTIHGNSMPVKRFGEFLSMVFRNEEKKI